MKKKHKNKSDMNDIRRYAEQIELEDTRKIIDIKELSTERTLMEDFENELSSNEPIRELFTAKNIKFKSQLTEEQRNAVSILYGMYKRCLSLNINFQVLKEVLDEYIDFGVSVERKGRTEFVEAHKSQLLQNQLQNQQMSQSMNQMKM